MSRTRSSVTTISSHRRRQLELMARRRAEQAYLRECESRVLRSLRQGQSEPAHAAPIDAARETHRLIARLLAVDPGTQVWVWPAPARVSRR